MLEFQICFFGALEIIKGFIHRVRIVKQLLFEENFFYDYEIAILNKSTAMPNIFGIVSYTTNCNFWNAAFYMTPVRVNYSKNDSCIDISYI